jgi:alpha-ketoglutarate-dependent taurine dioxygenase
VKILDTGADVDVAEIFDAEPPIPGIIEEWVTPGQSLPLIVRPDKANVNLIELSSQYRGILRRKLLRHGGLLFRGFPEVTLDTFHDLIRSVSGQPLQYRERSSPRHEVGNNIYTSTDYPARQSIFLHNEQSYNITWPLRIFFHCVIAAPAGGATPLADCRRVYRRISGGTLQKLAEAGYCYARHFDGGLGLTWEEAFQTDQRSVVEEYCLANDIRFSWESDGTLSTRQFRPVIVRHPETGEEVWFNHLTFFNVATLGQATVEALLFLGRDQIPNNTYYADGTDIEPEVMEELQDAYRAEKVSFVWHEGDILMLDNMLVAHGRESFTPPREVVVGMAEPYTSHSAKGKSYD